MFRLFFQPFVIAVVATMLWVVIHFHYGVVDSAKADEEIFASGTLMVFALFYGLIAAFIFTAVWGQWVDLDKAVKAKNKEKFNELMEERIPKPVKVMVAIFSFWLVGAFFVVSFKNWLTGIYSVSGVTYMVALFWGVIMDLDDPFKGAWNIKRPEDW